MMNAQLSRILKGMPVYGADEQEVGAVIEVQADQPDVADTDSGAAGDTAISTVTGA